MKFWKIAWPWVLGHKNQFRACWAQKLYQAISLKAWLQFSQKGPHFFQNYEINPIKSWNLIKYFELGVWGLKTTFGPLGLKRCFKLQFLQKEPHFLQNHKINPLKLWNLKNFLNLKSGTWKLHLGHLGSKDISSHKFRKLAPIFLNRGSFYPESWVESKQLNLWAT